MLGLNAAWDGLQQFLEMGGPVLVVILFATFVLWALILERLLYYGLAHRGNVQRAIREWNDRSDHKSWYAHAVRDKLISEVKLKTNQNVEFIKTMVALAPLLGLLGTVTGMVTVFDAMAISGSSDARAMSAGVSRATIPTMAGMVVALSGLFFVYRFESSAKKETAKLADKLDIRTS